jgi:hypothetical protein
VTGQRLADGGRERARGSDVQSIGQELARESAGGGIQRHSQERAGGGGQTEHTRETRRWRPCDTHGRKRQGPERCALLPGFDVGTRVSS